MALITCPDCGKQISENAAYCLNCGYPSEYFPKATPRPTSCYVAFYPNGDMVFQDEEPREETEQVYSIGEKEDWSYGTPWAPMKDLVSKVKRVVYQSRMAPISTQGWFLNFVSLTHIDISALDCSRLANAECMFTHCESLQSLDLSSFDTSQVTSMGGMFSNCKSLQSLDLSSFDTSKVTDMHLMFSHCESLQSLDLSGFDTSQVTSMPHMFCGCESLQSLDLTSFNTIRLDYAESMFWGCKHLQPQNITYSAFGQKLAHYIHADLNG